MGKVKKLAVIGAGTMGNGIAQTAASAGVEVTMVDVDEESLQKGFDTINKNLAKLKNKGRISDEDVKSINSNICGTLVIKKAVSGTDMVVEAVPENLKLKQHIFSELNKYCSADTILASCTSGISITAVASVTDRRDKVVGVHFTNPVPKMKGVAVITGMDTSEQTLAVTKVFLEDLGKEYWITKDFPGFSGTRIMGVYINEAFTVLQEGVASAEDIDKEMKMVLGHPMGPLELADYAGLDVILSSLEYLSAEKGDKYCPSPLLKQLVSAGYYGKKTGRGVYTYEKGPL